MKNMINWYEIPAKDLQRAIRFYQTVLDIVITETEVMDMKMGMFPGDGEHVSGAIIEGEDYRPSTEGSLLYLNGGNDLQHCLSRVEKAGGKVLLPKTQISPEFGYFALFLDSEGNKMAFHSPN